MKINMKNNNSSKHHSGCWFGKEYTMKPKSLFRRLVGDLQGVLLWLAVLPLAALAQANYATPYTFTTLAGLAGVAGSANGTRSAARFNYPIGMAADSAGNVYVGDYDNDTIRKVTPAGGVTTPAGLAGHSGTNDGTNSLARFGYPAGVAVDINDNVYVADWTNHTIRKVTPVGTNWVVTTIAGEAGNPGFMDGSPGQFDYPNGVAVDTNGNVYVADTANAAIREVTPVVTNFVTNWVVTTVSENFGGPTGVALDTNGNLYVADYVSDTILEVTLDGTNWVVTTLAGVSDTAGSKDGTGTNALFNDPFFVAVDNAGNLYVSDRYNFTIRKVTPVITNFVTNWVVTTLAGVPSTAGSTDGTGPNALFKYPAGVALDSAGNLYVADQDNFTIRKGFPASSVPPPILGPPILSNGQFDFGIAGLPNLRVSIESSSDLSNWQVVSTLFLTGGSNSFVTSLNPSLGAQFYRSHVR
jgi:sugar lactone lactonase YvrE